MKSKQISKARNRYCSAQIEGVTVFTHLSMTSVFSTLSFIWELSKIHPGLVWVLFGVAGEGIELSFELFFAKFHKRHGREFKVLDWIFWAVVVIGLGMEMSDAAHSDNQVIALNKMIEQAETLNQPIKSIKADVFFYLVDTNRSFFNPAPIPESALLTLRRKNEPDPRLDPLAMLSCSSLEPSWTVSLQKTGAVMTAKHATLVAMVFNWPSDKMVSNWPSSYITNAPRVQANVEYWIEKTNASVNDFDKQDAICEIYLAYLPKGEEILNGSCVLTINGSIQRRFLLPGKAGENEIVCLPAPK